jgi:CRP-like cAMP-binding protein
MQAGDYFGEMSLLTGEARTATIRAATACACYRLGREAIAPLLDSDPALMDLLSRNLAERNLSRVAKAAESDEGCPQQKSESLAAALLGKMGSIFRRGRAA